MPTARSPVTRQVVAMSSQERDLLYKLYVEQNMTAQEVADKFEISIRSVYARLKEHGISKYGYKKSRRRYCPQCGQTLAKKN